MAFLLDDPTTSIGGSLSGRVGSTIYARGRYAPFSYTYVPHVDADSQKQINMRSAFAWAAQEWKYESLANREAWASYAKNVSSINRVGERYWPSSFNRYVAAVTIRQWNGQFWPFPAPTIFVLAYHGSCDYGDWRDYYDRVRVRFDQEDEWRFQTQGRIWLSQSPPQPLSINRYHGPYTYFAGYTGHPLTPPIGRIFMLAIPPQGPTPRIFFKVRTITEDNRLSVHTYGSHDFTIPP